MTDLVSRTLNDAGFDSAWFVQDIDITSGDVVATVAGKFGGLESLVVVRCGAPNPFDAIGSIRVVIANNSQEVYSPGEDQRDRTKAAIAAGVPPITMIRKIISDTREKMVVCPFCSQTMTTSLHGHFAGKPACGRAAGYQAVQSHMATRIAKRYYSVYRGSASASAAARTIRDAVARGVANPPVIGNAASPGFQRMWAALNPPLRAGKWSVDASDVRKAVDRMIDAVAFAVEYPDSAIACDMAVLNNVGGATMEDITKVFDRVRRARRTTNAAAKLTI
jgi:hypothetical protein